MIIIGMKRPKLIMVMIGPLKSTMIDHPETIEVIEVIEAIEVDPPKTAIPLTPSEAIDPNTDPNPDYPTFNLLKYK